MLYTTKNCNVSPGERSGIVHGDNWKGYFGPFSGRAYAFANRRNINIDEATPAQIQSVGISAENAKNIKKRKFSNDEELREALMGMGIEERSISMLTTKVWLNFQ